MRQKRTRAPQLPRLHLRRRGLRGLVVEPGPLRVEPAGAHLRGPHVELGVFVLVQAGGIRERLRRRIRLGGERRRLDAVAVACVSFWFFFFRRERVSDGVFSERRLLNVRKDGRGRFGTPGRALSVRDRSRGTGRRERERGRPRRFFPESLRAKPRGVSGETRRGARVGRREDGAIYRMFGDVTHRQPWLARRS